MSAASNLTEEIVRDALRTVPYPGFSRDIVSFGLVRDIRIDDDGVTVEIEVTSSNPEVPARIRAAASEAVGRVAGDAGVVVNVGGRAPSEGGPPAGDMGGATGVGATQRRIPGVRHVIAVASGKGGVGKSTVAVNLACSLAQSGAHVGLLDCDIYGPSIPIMMGISERPEVVNNRIRPVLAHGIRLMSLGFIVEDDAPVIWRGPMVTKVVQQFLQEVDWNGLDYLVIDLPPGTGDAQLTLVQTIPVDGAVIVTTPQDVALVDARKGVSMFEKTAVPILGIVENMSSFVCPHCGKATDIFGTGGGRRESERSGVPLLGEVPIDPSVREGGDCGRPIVLSHPDSAAAAAFRSVAEAVRRGVATAPRG